MAKRATAKRKASTARPANPKSRIPNPKSRKHVYFFGGGKADGNRDMRDLLGGKGAGLAEMTNAGLPVPPSFTITTEACNWYSAHGNQFPKGMWEQVLDAVKKTEKAAGKKFGDPKN